MPDDLGSIVDRLTAAAQASPAAPAEEPAQPAWQGNVDRLLFAAGAPTERSFTPESFAAHRQRADVTEYGGAAQQEFQNFQPGGGEDVLRHSLPFVSAAITGIDRQAYSRARQAVAEGRAGPEEYRTVARYERRQQLESQHTSTGDLAVRGLLGIPAMLGEGYVGGAALRGLGLFGRAAAPVAEAASAPLTARAVAGFAGRTALQTATMPSMYVDQWTRRNLEEGRAANDWRGLPSAAALGMLQTAVLGSLGKFGNAISTAGVRGVAERLITRTAVGMLEQQGVDLFASAVSELLPRAYKLETGYGLLGHAIRREGGQFWQAALVQGVTFAAFSGIHEIQHGRPASAAEHREIIQTRGAQVLDAIQGTVDRLHEEGVPRERAGHSMAEFFGQVEGAMQGPQSMTPAQALEAALARTPEGPVRDMGTTLAELFPSVGERLGRQPAEPRELPPATAGPMQVPSRGPSLSDLSRPRVPEPPAPAPLAGWSFEQVRELAKSMGVAANVSRERMLADLAKAFGGEQHLRRLGGEQVPEQPVTTQPPPAATPGPETAPGTAPQPPPAPEAAPTPPNAAPTLPGPSTPVRQSFQGPTEVSTARLKAKGWSDKQIAEAQAEGLHAADAVTGFHEGRTGAVRHETVERAIEHTARTGEPGAYVEIDLRNLGGINATLGHEGANGFFGRVAKIIREELAGTQADVSLFRHGGDELSAVVVNGSRESVTEAMRRAHARIQEAAKEAGLESIEHPKHKGIAERRGTGIYFGVADMAKDSTPERLFSQADKEVEARKVSGLAAPLGRVSKIAAALRAKQAALGKVPTPQVQPVQQPLPPEVRAVVDRWRTGQAPSFEESQAAILGVTREAGLNARELHVIAERLLKRTHEDIGADPAMGRPDNPYTRERVRQIEARARAKIKEKFGIDIGSLQQEVVEPGRLDNAVRLAEKGNLVDASELHADPEATVKTARARLDKIGEAEKEAEALSDAYDKELSRGPLSPEREAYYAQQLSEINRRLAGRPVQPEGQPAAPVGETPLRRGVGGEVQPEPTNAPVPPPSAGGPGGNGPAAPTGPAQVPGQAGANRPEGPPALAGGGQAPGDLVARKAELTRRREELERRSEQLQEVYLDARKATKDAERRGDTEGVARNRIGVEHLERQINEVQAQMEVAIVHEANPSLASREQGDWRVRLWTYHKPDGAELARFQTEAAAAKAAAQAKTDFGDSGYRFAVERVPSKDTGGDLTALLSAIRKHGGRHNLADLLALRKELGWERERFDAAFREARLARLVHGEAREGRHGVTEEQRAADVSEDPQDPSRTVGYASLSEAGKAQVYTPVHLEQPKPPKVKSLYSVVRESGGIDPASVSFLASYRGVREALQDGLTLGIFKKGGRRLDELAQELHGSGHTDSPEPARLLELLRDKAVTMQADQSRQLAREQAEYERMRHELEQEEAAHVREHQDEINETLRAGEESGQAEAASEPFDQGGQESDDAGRRGQNLFGETTVEAGSLFDTPGLKDQPSRPRSFAELQADKREREAIAAARAGEAPPGSEGIEPEHWFGEPGEPGATGGDDGGLVHRRAMGAAALGELTPPGREQEGQRATALANARIDTERQADGLSPVLNSAKRERPEAWAKAMERFDRDPDAGRKLADELADKPRATNDVENIMLLRERVQAAAEFRRLDKLMERPGMDVLDLEASQKQADEWLQRMYTADTAARRSGTEWAWAGITRQQLMAEDFSFDGMLSQFRRAAGRDPTPEERKRIAELSDKIKALQAKLDASEKRYAETQRGPNSEEYVGMKDDRVAVAGAQADFGKIVTRAKEGRRTWGQTIGDLLIKLRVNEVISGLGTVGKLGMSSLQRLTITPLEEIGGMVWARVPGLAKIAALAPREGKGFSWVTEKQAVASGLVQGLKDAWRTIRTGESELDVLYGDKSDQTRSWLDWQFALHAGIKAPAVRAEYTRSFLKRLEQAAARGEDATSPAALMRHGLLAYKDSQAAKFQQENWLVDAYNKAVSHMRKPDMPVASQTVGTLARLLTPVVRIPTNLAFETARYAFGLGTGTVQAMRAHWITGLENLKPAEADAIMQQFKKGSLGMAALLVGAMNPGMFGGYYMGRRPDEDVRPGAVRIGGVNIGSWTQHNPLLQVFQVGAAFRRAYDASVRHGEGRASATGTAAWEAMSGWFQEIPLVRETGQVAGLFNHNARERGYYLGELAKSFAVPQFFQWLAGRLDTNAQGDVQRRRPVGVLQHIQAGVPGLRNQLPLGR